MVKRAEAVERNDDDGQVELARPIAHFVTRSEGDAPSADALDSEVGEAGVHRLDGEVDHGEIKGAIFRACGEKRGSRFAEMNRVGFIEGEDTAGGIAQEDRVVAVAGGDRLEPGGTMTLGAPRLDELAGEPGFAGAGVGAGDEEAGHGCFDRINKIDRIGGAK